MKSTRPAFTLIEIVVVIAIVATIAATTIPRMLQRTPRAEWSTILTDLNDIIFFARQEAITNQTVRRLMFQKSTNTQEPDFVVVQEEVDDPDRAGKKIWREVESYYATTKYKFHESIRLKGFYHNGRRQEELEEQRGAGYCHIVPDGLVEDVIVQLGHKDGANEFFESFVVSPFFGTFSRQEGLVKPGR
jgi:prepilin-type N-terminal cleavage/methylation domain-containing protein